MTDVSESGAGLRLDTFLPYQLLVAASETSNALSSIYAERHKLSMSEWRIIAALAQFRSLTGKSLGAYTCLHKTGVSRCTDRLARRKILSRSKSKQDLRESHWALTHDGLAIYKDLAPRALEIESLIVSALDPADREALDRASANW